MSRLRDRRPVPPPLPADLQQLVQPDDPEWFGRELAIAAAPHWWTTAVAAFPGGVVPDDIP